MITNFDYFNSLGKSSTQKNMILSSLIIQIEDSANQLSNALKSNEEEKIKMFAHDLKNHLNLIGAKKYAFAMQELEKQNSSNQTIEDFYKVKSEIFREINNQITISTNIFF